MAEITLGEVRDFLLRIQGREIRLNELRAEFNILRESKSWDGMRKIIERLTTEKIVKPSGYSRNDGVYKVIAQIKPVQVFGIERERRPPFQLVFPKDYNTKAQMYFAEQIVIREGDLVLIAGMSNFGKTTLCMNFAGENIDKLPVLMGNEYTTIDQEPTPRFINRLESMDWVQWVDENGYDKFTLLPVWEDYAEHIIKDRINIVDWVNLPGEYYLISPLMEGMKRAVGRGVGVITIQKNEGNVSGRGGALTKDFADCELLIDRFGKDEVLLTVGKVKEWTKNVMGKTYAYAIVDGVKIVDFREVKKCPYCRGSGYTKSGECDTCFGSKFVNC